MNQLGRSTTVVRRSRPDSRANPPCSCLVCHSQRWDQRTSASADAGCDDAGTGACHDGRCSCKRGCTIYSTNANSGPSFRISHRQSLPNLLPSSRNGFNPDDLPVALQRLKDVDLETFKLERACGMTPDPVHMFWPKKLIAAADEGVFERPKCAVPDECFGSTNRPLRQSPLSTEIVSHPRSASLLHSSNFSSDISGRKKQRILTPFTPRHSIAAKVSRLEKILHGGERDQSAALDNDTAHNALPGSFLQVERLMREYEKVENEHAEIKQFGRERNRNGIGWGVSDREEFAQYSFVFGQSLSRMLPAAICGETSKPTSHDLPLVVFACIEELYRTGMTMPGLFRTAPGRTRHQELIELYDQGPAFGRDVKLEKESTPDICALLRTYIDRLPHPLLLEPIFDAFWTLCVLPSQQRREKSAEEDSLSSDDLQSFRYSSDKHRPLSLVLPQSLALYNDFGATSGRPRSQSLGRTIPFSPSSSPRFNSIDMISRTVLSETDLEVEKSQIEAAQVLISLLPRPHKTLLIYLLSFFCCLPLSPQNELGVSDITRMFSVPLLLAKRHEHTVDGESENRSKDAKEDYSIPRCSTTARDKAAVAMGWMLRRWNLIVHGIRC